jgi:uncharacterized membrane protein
MHNIVRDVAGRLVGWLFVIGSAGLTGLGIYLGRFLNWNSWDLVLRPQAVLGDVAHRLIHPLSNLQTYGVTVMFAAFLFACYWMFTSMHRPEQT